MDIETIAYLNRLIEEKENVIKKQEAYIVSLEKEYHHLLQQIGKYFRYLYKIPDLIEQEKHAKQRLNRAERISDSLYHKKNTTKNLELQRLTEAQQIESQCREKYKEVSRKRQLAENKLSKTLLLLADILKHTATLTEEEIVEFISQKKIDNDSIIKAINLQAKIILKRKEKSQTENELKMLQNIQNNTNMPVGYTKQKKRASK